MNIACVYKSGGDYGPEYVAAFSAGLTEYFAVNYKLFCLTDRPHEIERYAEPIELRHDLPGWWSKIELFNQRAFRDDRVLYLDLDVMIIDEINDFVELCVSSTMPLMLRSVDPLGKANDWPSTSIMCWDGNSLKKVYSAFFALGPQQVMEQTMNGPTGRAGQRTDQGFIRKVANPAKFQDYLPDKYIQFKTDYMNDGVIWPEAHIMNWTGHPRIHNMKNGHLKHLWGERINYGLIKDV